MLTIRQAELILPTGREYRCTRSLGLASVFCNTLIDLRGIQVEYDQILTIGMDDLCSATRFLRNSDRIIEKK